MSNYSNLTQKQWDVVNDYMTNGRNKVGAVRTALPHVKDPDTTAYKMFKNPKIISEISRREDDLRRTTAHTEADLLERMWGEATSKEKGSQHSARIAALVKYADWAGYFKDGKDDGDNGDGGIHLHVTNYADGETTVASTTKKAIEQATPKELEDASELTGIEIKRYD